VFRNIKWTFNVSPEYLPNPLGIKVQIFSENIVFPLQNVQLISNCVQKDIKRDDIGNWVHVYNFANNCGGNNFDTSFSF
jgi:hypothetical protein